MADSKATTHDGSQPHWVRSAVIVIAITIAAWFALRGRSNDSTKAVRLGDIVEHGAAAGFNVLLITLDTTRQDHLGCYGCAYARTPTIDALVSHGVRFDNAVTSVPLTLPSHATIMTGLYPPSCGVRDNGIHALADKYTTLAERFKAAGYDTAAFIAAFVLDKRFGMAQGFDTYDFEIGEEGRLGADSLQNERRGDAVSTSAIRWLDARFKNGATAPLFMWVHYYDPHQPYNSPVGDLPQFEGRIYDAEIGFADMQLKRLLDAMEKHGMLDNTLIVFVTDHGEGLFDHDESVHGIFLYETTVQTGMVLSSPKLFDRAYRVDDRLVGTVDIVPTVLDLMGMEHAENVDGQSLLDDIDPDRAIYMETLFPADNGCRPLYALRRMNDKFIDAPVPEYYDLASDPNELRNLYVASDDRIRSLAERLAQVRSAWADVEDTPFRSMTPADRARLDALGYAGGGSHDDVDTLPDCKDQIATINRMTEVSYLKQNKRYDEAIALATEVMHESEGWDAPVRNLAEMYVNSGRNLEAAAILREFTAKHPSAESLLHLAQLELYFLDDVDAALATLEAANILDPSFGIVYITRGDAYVKLDRLDEAEEQYRKAIEVDADRVEPDAIDKLENLAKLRKGGSN